MSITGVLLKICNEVLVMELISGPAGLCKNFISFDLNVHNDFQIRLKLFFSNER